MTQNIDSTYRAISFFFMKLPYMEAMTNFICPIGLKLEEEIYNTDFC